MTFNTGVTNGSFIYFDGALVRTFTHNISHQDVRLVVGNGTDAGGAYQNFGGSIDEVRVWNTIRTSTQIAADMNCDVPQQAALVLNYRFNEGTAGGTNTSLSKVADYSGNNNCGNINNIALTGSSSNFVTGAIGTCNTITIAAANTGTASVTVGSTTTLSNTTVGGTWSSSNTSIASVGSSTGIVAGNAAGTAVISYSTCFSTNTTVVTVNSASNAMALNGTGSYIQSTEIIPSGGSYTKEAWVYLTNPSLNNNIISAYGHPFWVPGSHLSAYHSFMVQDPATFPFNAWTHVAVTYDAATTTMKLYKNGILVASNTSVTAHAGGNIQVGAYASANLLEGKIDEARVWNVARTATQIAADMACDVPQNSNLKLCYRFNEGVANGTNTGVSKAIDYSGNNNCGTLVGFSMTGSTSNFTSGPVPTCNAIVTSAANTGTASICAGATTTLSNAVIGGTWSSSNTLVATVGSTGLVTGIAGGTATVSYATCYATATTVVTVSSVPAIGGATAVCAGSTITLTNDSAGGTWSSTNAYRASVNTSGVVTGITAGTVNITYANAMGCFATKALTVNPSAAPIIAAGTGIITTFAGNGGSSPLGDGGPATAAAVRLPLGVSVDPSGNTYIVDNNAQRIRKVNTAGVISTFAGNGSTGFSGDGGPATAATFGAGGLTDVVADRAGNVYICDGNNYRIRKVDPNGIITTVAGNGTTSHTGDGGPATAAGIAYTSGIAVDKDGILYISGYGKIRKVSASGIITTIAGINGGGSYSDGVPATTSYMNPYRISVDNAGNVYFVDQNVHRLRRVNTSGIVNTLAGTGTAAYSGDGGPATAAALSSPSGVYADGFGNIIIGDGGNGRLRQVSPSGVITTLAGNGTFTNAGDGGPATAAALAGAYGVTKDLYDNILVSSNGGNKVRKIALYRTDITLCSGTTTNLYNANAGGTWSSGNTAVATIGATTGLLTGVTGGTAVISYTMPGGCFVTNIVTVNATPSVSAGADTAICIGDATTLTATGATTYTWAPGTGLSATTGASVTANPTSSLTYTIIGTTGTCSATATKAVSVNPVPTIAIASFSPNPTLPGLPVNFTVSDATLASYSWNFGDATTSTTMNPSKAYASGGTYIPTLTATNSYGCPASDTAAVTVLPSAGSLMGYNPPLCTADVPDTLRSIISGGTWSSSNTGAAIIGSTSGILTAVAPGVATITYHLGGGYIQTLTVLAGNSPNPIFGPATTCMGFNTGLNVLPYGSAGAWSSSTTGVATIGTGTGICAAVSLGTTTITWTLPSGCYVTRTQTVVPTPAAITGPSFLCVADTVTYLNDTVGGTWSSSNSGVVSVNATSGLATGMAAGTATLSYTIAYGCAATKLVNGGGLPAAITGGLLLCPSGTSTLSCATAGGAWSTGDVAVATVTGGVVTGVSAGTANITYTLTSGCRRVVTVTVNAAPGTSTGTASLCVGGATTLSNAATGGTWSSSSTATATVGSASGVVTGIAAGNANITYTVAGAGCYTITVVTVNAASGAITGTLNACVGDTSVLSHTSTGGTWISSNTALATVDAASGAAAGVAAGTATITYFVSASCYVTTSFTVKALPTAISGTASVCVGSTTTLASGPTGGTWSSSASGTAPVNASTGLVSGYAAGTATISYSISNGCRRTQVVTVNAAPTAIIGATGVCVGGTTTLTDTTAGGTWSSSNTAVATIDGTTGVVSGIATGTSLISYTLGTGCRTTRVLSVVAVPAAITGTATLCAGSVTTLSSTTGGGTWSSSDITAATTGTATGTSTTVSGVSAGNATISYTVAGCATTRVVTVNASPGTISGPNPMCIGNSGTFSIGSTGGTWVSSASYVTIGSATGIATGIAAGAATISYRVNATCYSTRPVTVTATPAAITGTARVCIGSTTILGHPVSGGSWSGSSSAASVTDSAGFGVVSGSIAGTATITYTLPSGCYKTVVVTVNSNPATPTGGTSPVCAGATTTLAATPAGGTWSSSNTAVGTVGATTGVVMGVSAGTATITYRITATSCYATKEVSVNPLPGPITGSTSVCVGASTTLTDTAAGGIWTMTPATVATIGVSTGLVNGVVAGAATVTYTLPTGCRRTGSISVLAAPAAITGNLSICVGNTTTLASSPAALTWSSSDVTTATVSTAGVVTGAAAGNATISYTNAAGCSRTAVVTVNTALPANTSSTGSFSVCSGTTITLSNSVSGGTWNSSSSAIAAVGSSTGVVTGSATGAANITYSLGTGCRSISTVSVNAAAPAITGTTSVCAGSSVTFTATGTGSWSSADAGIATVAGGVVTGVAAGSTIITYTTASGCTSVKSILVKVVPVIGAPSIMTAGDTLTASSTVSGGTWSSSSAAIAGVTSTTGLITAMSPGSVTISFTASSTGCVGTWGIYVMNASAGKAGANTATANMFSIYPNPTNGTLTISTSVAGELSIYTIDGKVTGEYSMTAGANSVQLSSDLAAGVYICQFTGTDGSTQQARLILQH
jgi:uncharacterized protein YjdB